VVPPGSVRALVLAAGGSRRFGGRKLLALLHGRPLAAYALDAASAARDAGLVDGTTVVLPAGEAALAALASAVGAAAVTNPSPEAGLSGSLRLGLLALAAEPTVAAALVLLADQPTVRLSTVGALVEAWRAGAGTLVRPRYRDAPAEPGHPVLLDRSAWHLAERLEGDAGFGCLHDAALRLALVDVPGDNPDVDTPTDLALLEELP
jgi:molybdenum cofactor cytidylyltransferase